MDRRRGAAKRHAQPDPKEAGPRPASHYPFAPPSHFYAGKDARGKNSWGACIFECPWGQTRQLGSLVEVYLQADGSEWLDAPRPAKNLRDPGGRTRRRTTYRKYYPRSQKPREQPTPRHIQ